MKTLLMAIFLCLAAVPAMAQDKVETTQKSAVDLSTAAPKVLLYVDKTNPLFTQRIQAGKMTTKNAADEYLRWIVLGHITYEEMDSTFTSMEKDFPGDPHMKDLKNRLKTAKAGTQKLTLKSAVEEYARWVRLGFMTYDEMDGHLRMLESKKTITREQSNGLRTHLKSLID